MGSICTYYKEEEEAIGTEKCPLNRQFLFKYAHGVSFNSDLQATSSSFNLETLQEQLEKLKTEKHELTTENQDLKDRLVVLTSKINESVKLRQGDLKLKGQIEILQKDKQDLEVKLGRLEAENFDLREQNKLLINKVQELSNQSKEHDDMLKELFEWKKSAQAKVEAEEKSKARDYDIID